MKVTIQQVADMCNVSRGTVDRVLHNRPNVHPQIRQTVLAALSRAGYRSPSQRRQSTSHFTAGMILPAWPDRYFLTHTLRGIRTALGKLDKSRFTLLTDQLSGRSIEEHIEAIKRLRARGVNDIILNAPMIPNITALLNDAITEGGHVITYFDELPQCPASYYVGQDVVRSGRVAAGLMAKYMRPGERVLAVSGDLLFHSHRGRVYSFAHHLGELVGDQSAVEIVYCHEYFEATAQAIHQQLILDDRIRYVYMATQSVPGCIEGIRRALLPYKNTVICNDTTAAAHEFLESGDVDFVIGQNAAHTAAQAVETMYKILCLDIEPRTHKLYTDLTIYTKQMLHQEEARK